MHSQKLNDTVDGSEIQRENQLLRLAVYPIISLVSYMFGGAGSINSITLMQ